MIIPNKFIKLDYNPTTDVLFVEWPNMHDYTLPEIEFILEELVNTVKYYNVRRILADSRKSKITLRDDAYAQVVNQLVQMLNATHLEKFARLVTTEANRESIANNAATLLNGSIQYQSFANTDVAIAWLTA